MDWGFSNSFKRDRMMDTPDPNSINAAVHVSQMLSDIKTAKEASMYHSPCKLTDGLPAFHQQKLVKQRMSPGSTTLSPSKGLKSFPQNSVVGMFSRSFDPSNKYAMNPLTKSTGQNFMTNPNGSPSILPFAPEELPYFYGNVPVCSLVCGSMNANSFQSFATAEPVNITPYFNNNMFAIYDETGYPANFIDPSNLPFIPMNKDEPQMKKPHKLNPEAAEYIPQTMRYLNQNTKVEDNLGCQMNKTVENENGLPPVEPTTQSDYGFINNETVHSDYGFINNESGTANAIDSEVGNTESSCREVINKKPPDLKGTGLCNTSPHSSHLPSVDVTDTSSLNKCAESGEHTTLATANIPDLQNNSTDILQHTTDINTSDTNRVTHGNDEKLYTKTSAKNNGVHGNESGMESDYSATDYSDADDDTDDSDTEDEDDDTDTGEDDTESESDRDDGISFEIATHEHDDSICFDEGDSTLLPEDTCSTADESVDTSSGEDTSGAEDSISHFSSKRNCVNGASKTRTLSLPVGGILPFLLSQSSTDSDDDDEDDDSDNDWQDEETDDRNYKCELFKLDLEDDESWGLPVGGGLIISQLVPQGSDVVRINIISPLGSDDLLLGNPEWDEVDSCFTAELEKVNRLWEEQVSVDLTKSTPTKVRFSGDDQVECVEDWCRRGPWEQYARDRKRFERRIEEIDSVLSPVLSEQHRHKVLESRLREPGSS